MNNTPQDLILGRAAELFDVVLRTATDKYAREPALSRDVQWAEEGLGRLSELAGLFDAANAPRQHARGTSHTPVQPLVENYVHALYALFKEQIDQ